MHSIENTTNDIEITLEVLKRLLDYSSDEIFILNRNEQIIYVNSACEKHYGLKKEDVIGQYSNELVAKGYWKPSIFPEVYERKKPISMIQTTYVGAELLTTAVPILNEQGEIDLVVTTARELQNYKLLQHEGDKSQVEAVQEQGIFTNSNLVKDILLFTQKVAATNSTILIQGESGTGKSILANYIHEASKRKEQPFLTINCAAIPENLLESELFGYAKGAFTGANPSGKMGLLESANNGTVFLDEIGDISLELQAKLLQVIENKEFIPLGSEIMKKVDIRFIAATNRNLIKMIERELFREDLYYRLNVIDITMPPLREREEDIIPLIYNFLYKFNQLHEKDKLISKESLEILTDYSWPGNIRQLENLIERLVVVSDAIIEPHDLPEVIYDKEKIVASRKLPATLKEAEEQVRKDMVRESFRKHRSSRKVAEDLNVSQTTATRLIQRHCHDLHDKIS